MPYILPKGSYYDAGDHVAVGSTECAVRPVGYVLTTTWRSNPLDVDICWRAKNQAENDADTQDEEDEMRFPNVLQTLAKGMHDQENRLRALEGKPGLSLKQSIKELRKL